MKTNTNSLTENKATRRSVRRGRLSSLDSNRAAKSLDTDATSSKSDQSDTTIRSGTSTTVDSSSNNSATYFSQNILQRRGDVWRYMALCYDLDLERRQLSQMTREQLEDVGLDHYSANQEARRNFFDIPPQRYGKSDKGTNHIRRNNRFVIFSLTGVLISVALLLVFGYVITLSVAAGFAGGFLVLWISRALRKYPTHHFDERETD